MKRLLQSLVLRSAIVAVAAFAMVQLVSAEDAEDFLKDLHIRQRPMVEAITPPVRPANSGTSLAVTATVDRPDLSYQDGDTLVLTVQTTEDAYVWVFDTGTSGTVHQIFPNKYETANFLAANTPLRIPQADSNYQFTVSRPQGRELITVIASKNSAPLTQDLIDTTGGGAFLALRGNAASVAKDLAITLREQHSDWVKDQVAVMIK